MAKRNLKKENLKKLSQIITANGFKIDLVNYMYNPAYNHDYPNLVKLAEETKTERHYIRVYYFKYYDGKGKYFLEKFTHKKDNDNDKNPWKVSTKNQEIELEDNNRFNLKHLIELAENIETITETKKTNQRLTA